MQTLRKCPRCGKYVVASEYPDHQAACLDAEEQMLGVAQEGAPTAGEATPRDWVRVGVYTAAVVFLVLLTTCVAIGYKTLGLWLGSGFFLFAFVVKFYATYFHPIITWWRGNRTTRSGKGKSSPEAW